MSKQVVLVAVNCVVAVDTESIADAQDAVENVLKTFPFVWHTDHNGDLVAEVVSEEIIKSSEGADILHTTQDEEARFFKIDPYSLDSGMILEESFLRRKHRTDVE